LPDMKRFIQPRITRVNIARFGPIYHWQGQRGPSLSTVASAAQKRGRPADSRSLVLRIAPRLLIAARSRAIAAPHERALITSQQPTEVFAHIDATNAAAAPIGGNRRDERVNVIAPSPVDTRTVDSDSWRPAADIERSSPEIDAGRPSPRTDREPRVVALARSIARVIASPFARSDEHADASEHKEPAVGVGDDDSDTAEDPDESPRPPAVEPSLSSGPLSYGVGLSAAPVEQTRLPAALASPTEPLYAASREYRSPLPSATDPPAEPVGEASKSDRSPIPTGINRLTRIFRSARSRDGGASTSWPNSGGGGNDVLEAATPGEGRRGEPDATVGPAPALRQDINHGLEEATAPLPVGEADERREWDEHLPEPELQGAAIEAPNRYKLPIDEQVPEPEPQPTAIEVHPAQTGSPLVSEMRERDRGGLVARIIGRRRMTPDTSQMDTPASRPGETAASSHRTPLTVENAPRVSRPGLAARKEAQGAVIRRTPSRLTAARDAADDGRACSSDGFQQGDHVRLPAPAAIPARSLTMRTPVMVRAGRPMDEPEHAPAFARSPAPPAPAPRGTGRVIARAPGAQPSTTPGPARGEAAGNAPAALATPEAGELQLPEGAMDRLARDVFDQLRRRLLLERERSGRVGRWSSI